MSIEYLQWKTQALKIGTVGQVRLGKVWLVWVSLNYSQCLQTNIYNAIWWERFFLKFQIDGVITLTEL